eukprot:6923829-Prorocentrum_lima.AAC.1
MPGAERCISGIPLSGGGGITGVSASRWCWSAGMSVEAWACPMCSGRIAGPGCVVAAMMASTLLR